MSHAKGHSGALAALPPEEYDLSYNPDGTPKSSGRPSANVNIGDDDDKTPPGFADLNPSLFEDYVFRVTQLADLDRTPAKAFINDWFDREGMPDGYEWFDNQDFVNGLMWKPIIQQLPELPPIFNYVDPATGVPQLVRLDPLRGVVPTTGPRSPLQEQPDQIPGESPLDIASGTIPQTAGLQITGAFRTLSAQQIAAMYAAKQRPTGTGRQRRVFDKNQLRDQAKELWRSLMLEEPDNVESIVDNYAKEANAFWLSKGGNLDFSTYVRDRARSTSRYKMLYKHKPESFSEQAYLGQFVSAVGQFGFNPTQERRLIESAAASGATGAGTQRRLRDSVAASRLGQGSFSQRFANTLRQSATVLR